MTGLQTTARTLSKGDVIQLGDVVESDVQHGRSGLQLIALHRGETEEYVVLATRFEDGETIEVPEDAQILAVADGHGRGHPVCWMIIPTEVYGE